MDPEEFPEDRLALSLSLPSTDPILQPPLLSPPPPPPSPPRPQLRNYPTGRNGPAPVRTEHYELSQPPYPWATTRPATVHSLDHLLTNQISTIQGEFQCKRCGSIFMVGFDLQIKFAEVSSFINLNKGTMHHRAPNCWKHPKLLDCPRCNRANLLKPVISNDKDSINWLCLLLGQMLGCCTLDQLKYFLGHNSIHRTGAKDRLLYLTYLGICKQLDHTGPFDP